MCGRVRWTIRILLHAILAALRDQKGVTGECSILISEGRQYYNCSSMPGSPGFKAQVLADLTWRVADVKHIGGTPTEMRNSYTQKYLEIKKQCQKNFYFFMIPDYLRSYFQVFLGNEYRISVGVPPMCLTLATIQVRSAKT